MMAAANKLFHCQGGEQAEPTHCCPSGPRKQTLRELRFTAQELPFKPRILGQSELRPRPTVSKKSDRDDWGFTWSYGLAAATRLERHLPQGDVRRGDPRWFRT